MKITKQTYYDAISGDKIDTEFWTPEEGDETEEAIVKVGEYNISVSDSQNIAAMGSFLTES